MDNTGFGKAWSNVRQSGDLNPYRQRPLATVRRKREQAIHITDGPEPLLRNSRGSAVTIRESRACKVIMIRLASGISTAAPMIRLSVNVLKAITRIRVRT
jgi:hypothetical protein